MNSFKKKLSFWDIRSAQLDCERQISILRKFELLSLTGTKGERKLGGLKQLERVWHFL